MEETKFKTDHSQHGKLGDYAFTLPKLILFVLSCRKKKKEVLEKKKEVLVKVRFSVRSGFGYLKRALNFYTPFSIHFATTYR